MLRRKRENSATGLSDFPCEPEIESKNKGDMKQTGENAHSFIVRIWREAREIKGRQPEWRGVIEHVLSGEKRHLDDLEEIPKFIEPFLKGMGVK